MEAMRGDLSEGRNGTAEIQISPFILGDPKRQRRRRPWEDIFRRSSIEEEDWNQNQNQNRNRNRNGNRKRKGKRNGGGSGRGSREISGDVEAENVTS
ncbi:hypothetical protein U1Q18_011475 [Sarracenia purpurea var. burkii]